MLARVPTKSRAAFLGRKHTTTQNVMAAVDFDLRFTYVLASWEGSAHDALILTDVIQRDDGLKVPQGIHSLVVTLGTTQILLLIHFPFLTLIGKFFLGDAGYAVRPGFLPPYRGTRYHLREYGTRNPQNPRELFNLRHSSFKSDRRESIWCT